MSRIRMKLSWLALGVVGVLLAGATRATAEPGPEPSFGGCPGLCQYTDCWNPQEGWCPGHCNTTCIVCG